jgi:hypothetical protein
MGVSMTVFMETGQVLLAQSNIQWMPKRSTRLPK